MNSVTLTALSGEASQMLAMLAEGDDSPEKDRFSGFHHPVSFRSHLERLSLARRAVQPQNADLIAHPLPGCATAATLRSPPADQQ